MQNGKLCAFVHSRAQKANLSAGLAKSAGSLLLQVATFVALLLVQDNEDISLEIIFANK